MNYVLFAFRSRTQSMRFYDELSRRGVPCAIVNTPRFVSVGCGLSVRTDESDFARAVEVLRGQGANTFTGAFRVTGSGGERKAERLMLRP